MTATGTGIGGALQALGVAGGGIMGSGIAEVAARAGCDVVVFELDEPAAERSRARVTASLGRAVTAGKLARARADAALAAVRWTTDLAGFADRDVVIEAIAEHEAAKHELFSRLAGLVRPDTLLASNTSSLPITRIAAAVTGPERVLGIHFFNPVPVLPLVELVPGQLTAPEALAAARRFAGDRLGKTTIVARDRAGFVVNALLIPYLLAAIRMVEGGFATAEDVDAGMVAGCAHPMGPLRLVDLIGLDTTAAAAESMYAEFKEPLYAPPPLLLRLIEAGRLGRKSGAGFYDYS